MSLNLLNKIAKAHEDAGKKKVTEAGRKHAGGVEPSDEADMADHKAPVAMESHQDSMKKEDSLEPDGDHESSAEISHADHVHHHLDQAQSSIDVIRKAMQAGKIKVGGGAPDTGAM